MKKITVILSVFVAMLVCFSSCVALHNGMTSNVNNKTTNVVLSKNNYKIIAKVKGTASGTSVFGFGGSFQPLVERARAEMLENAGLIGASKAVINETVEVNHKSYVGIVIVKTITVSAYVVEFKNHSINSSNKAKSSTDRVNEIPTKNETGINSTNSTDNANSSTEKANETPKRTVVKEETPQNCETYLLQAAAFVSERMYCEARKCYEKYQRCDADVDVSAEIAMCERYTKLQGEECND